MMSSEDAQKALSAQELLVRSLLYRQAQAQREEILRHKWFQSEKAGRDVGFDLARTDWTLKHRAEWLKHWRRGTS